MTSKNGIKVAVIIPARNEEKNLPHTLNALLSQTIKPDLIIVVDDGSKDKTAEIAKSFGCIVVRRPDRKYRATGMPVLATVINSGLSKLKTLKSRVDYVVILGADHILPSRYLEKIITRMEENSDVVIASGIILGERMSCTDPRGSGRVIKFDFWNEIGLKYPVNYGWESYIIYKAKSLGYKVKVYQDIETTVLRPTGKSTKYFDYGRAMKCMGYPFIYVLARTAITSIKNPKAAVKMLSGYFSSCIFKYSDIAPFVNKLKKRELLQELSEIIKSLF
ncbi:MAG: glycosyltransferase family 2 protein [Candidatus Odinarchaeota archaeon]|nr:glycosyltransferase family 2 protein [Candidatus Odinarchaeota archaeon]